MLFAFCIIILFPAKGTAQPGFLREIRDSLLQSRFGSVAFIYADNNAIYTIYNSRYIDTAPFIGGEVSKVIYTKLNKSSGQIIDKHCIKSSYILNCEDAVIKNQALYLGGSVNSPNQPLSAFILKFNYLTKTIVWEKDFHTLVFNNLANTINCKVNSVLLNSNSSHILFNGIGPFPSTGYRNDMYGAIDTNSINGFGVVFGWYWSPTSSHLASNSRIALLSTTGKKMTICNDTATGHVLLDIDTNSAIFFNNMCYFNELNLTSNGVHFISSIRSKFFCLIDNSSGSHCILIDSLKNVLQCKTFPGLRAKSLSTFKNQAVLTFVNSIGVNKGNELITVRVDSVLQITQTRKMYIDTFQVDAFTCKTFLDSSFAYHIFSKKRIFGKSIYVFKESNNLLSCNQLTTTAAFTVPVISSTLVAATYSGGVGQTNYSMSTQNWPVKDSVYCFNGVSPTPQVNFAFQNPCVGSNASFTDLTSNNPNFWNWTFTGANTYSSNIQNPQITFTASGLQTVILTASNNFGSGIQVQQVNVYPLPVITVNSGSCCPGGNFTISASGANTYTYFPYGPVISPQAPIVYSVSGTSTNGCVSQSPGVGFVGLYSSPNVSIVTTKTLVCVGEALTLNGLGALSYVWNTSATTPSIVVTPTAQTVYSVTGIDTNGCINSATIQIKTSSCLIENELISKSLEFVVFPNPVSSDLDIKIFSAFPNTRSQLFIINILGEISIEESLPPGVISQSVSLQHLAEGIYTAVIIKQGIIATKLISVLRE